MKVVINPNYANLNHFILTIPLVFNDDSFGNMMHNSRNVIKNVEDKLVIKKFVKITWANRIIYSFFRKSKAQRSYEYAFELKRRNIDTPNPIAYIELKRFGVLKDAYYICEYSNYQTVDSIFTSSANDERINVATKYAEYIGLLHTKGIQHRDLHASNVLYMQCSITNTINFQLVDINRIIFHKGSISNNRCIENLLRIAGSKKWFYFIISVYEEKMGFSDGYVLRWCIFCKALFKVKNKIKHFIKKLFCYKYDKKTCVATIDRLHQ